MSANEMRKLMTLVESSQLDEFSLSGLGSRIKNAASKFVGGKDHATTDTTKAVDVPSVDKDNNNTSVEMVDSTPDEASAKSEKGLLTYDGEIIKYSSSVGFEPTYLVDLVKIAFNKLHSSKSAFPMYVPNVNINDGSETGRLTFLPKKLASVAEVIPVFCRKTDSFGLFIAATLDTSDLEDQYSRVFQARSKKTFNSDNQEHADSFAFADGYVNDMGRIGVSFIEVKYDGTIGAWYNRTFKGNLSDLRSEVKSITGDFIVDRATDLEHLYSERSSIKA